MPAKASEVRWQPATWSAEQLDSGMSCAREVVRQIRAGAFEPSPDLKPSPYDAFARICQTTVRQRGDG